MSAALSEGSHAGSRRIILVDFTWTRDKDPRIPLGHASLLAALHGVPKLDVRSVMVPVNTAVLDADDVATMVAEQTMGAAPDQVDVAFGAYVWGEELLRDVLPAVRRRGFRGRIILGGPQISYSGAGLETIYPEADVFVRGYGEEALAALVQSHQPQIIRGVHWAGAPDLKEQASVKLEALPSPWLTGATALTGQRFIRWETQRGCPFRCSFCQHREAGARLHRRSLLASRIDEEIDLFCSAGVAEIAVLDPIFNIGPRSTAVLERFVRRGFRGRLSLQCRAELVTEAFLEAAEQLEVTLEFGLQTVHEQESAAVNRKNNITKVDQVLAAVRRRGIDHEVSLIFGLPLQTPESFKESVRWCLERQVPVIKAFPLLLLRGTELERDRDRWGFVEGAGAMPPVIESNSFDKSDWLAMASISEALSSTEGHHPPMDQLLRLARDLEPTMLRWQPPTERRAS